jgi:hypothetical protein
MGRPILIIEMLDPEILDGAIKGNFSIVSRKFSPAICADHFVIEPPLELYARDIK